MFKRIFHGFILLAFVAGLLAVTPVQRARALTLTVTNTNDTGSGSLRQAIADAVDGDVIDATGISGTITLASQLLVDYDITINGPGMNDLTVSGNNSVRVFFINPAATVSINDLTIANGKVLDDNGGGIYNQGNLTLNYVTVSGNQVQSRWMGPVVMDIAGGVDIGSANDNRALGPAGRLENVTRVR